MPLIFTIILAKMKLKKLQDKIKYLISEDLFDEAREFAKKNNLKETEVDTIGISNYYLAAQKAKKYGLYKKALDFYSKMDPNNIKNEILEIYKISSKEDNSKLSVLLNKNTKEKQEINPADFNNYSEIIPIDEYPPISNLINQN